MEDDPIRMTLGRPAHGGACIAHVEGKTYFVRGGLPGEVVDARITAAQKRISWAQVEKVLEPSSDRTRDDTVVGADLSHMTPAASRRWKTEVLWDQLKRTGSRSLAEAASQVNLGLEVVAVPGDEDEPVFLSGRRTRMRFGVSAQGRLTMTAFRTNDPVELEGHPFVRPEFAPVFTSPQWHSRLAGNKNVTLLAPTGSGPLVVGDNECWNLAGTVVEPRAVWSVKGYEFAVDARGFWQLHPGAAETLVDAVLEQAALRPGQSVIELYSGAGLFTRFIAQSVGAEGTVATLEGNAQAVADAEANCRGVEASVQFFIGSVDATAVRELSGELDNRVGAIILDPPRTGAGKAVIQALSKTSAEQVTLISCDPAAGARDMENLHVEGFSLRAIAAFDLFPHTHHFETVSTWRR